ncbi:MAG: ABC transporter ATP-binding protein [Sphingobacteriia bacterium]|nr:ABC transporter ATP-binding protein [Sphingobacteriia bacterium]
MSKTLTLKNIYKTYLQAGEIKINVLNNITFELNAGEMIALVGPSGCGKTTLLQIAGLLDTADSGEIIIDNVICNEISDNIKTNIRAEKLGFVYQFHNLLKDFTVLENVMMASLLNNVSPNNAKEKAVNILEQVGLSHRITHYPSQISGGEQQRVAVARALVHNPKILLADEPTGNLDPQTAENVFQIMRSTLNKNNTSAIIVTHNVELANKLDRKFSITNGKLEEII